MQPMITRLVILILVLACGVGMFVVVNTLETAPLKQAQQVAQERFGADLIKLCQGATETRGVLPTNSKISAINAIENTVYDIYDAAIPANMKATDKSDVTVLLCLKEDKTVYDKAEYGDPTKYVCTQYERDLVGYLVDAKTGKTFDYRKIPGPIPPDCPDSTDSNVTETGDTPRASDITTWLKQYNTTNA